MKDSDDAILMLDCCLDVWIVVIFYVGLLLYSMLGICVLIRSPNSVFGSANYGVGMHHHI